MRRSAGCMYALSTRILSRANKKWEEEIDGVKRMNSMMLYARTAAAREVQKQEKLEKIIEEKAYNERMDAIMMMKLKKEGEIGDKCEAVRAEMRRQGAVMLQSQIAEAEAQRQIEEEMKELEGQHLLQELERQRQEDFKLAQKRYEAGQQLLAEIMKYNEDQIERKRQTAQFEKEEEERINLYIYNKTLKEQQYHEEIERKRKVKELETARLRAMQEKAQDRQSQLDELHAQRVQEALEREWREKEKKEAEKHKKMNEQLAQAREEQKLLKMKRMADQAKQEHVEFYRVIEEQKEAIQHIKEEEEKVRKRNYQNKQEILEQIRNNQEERERLRKQELEHGEKIRLQAKAELELLAAIKASKLQELEKEGVPEKYRAELARKKVDL